MLGRILLLPLLATLIIITNADAKMYRWVDENGVTVYSQTPPPSGDATELNIAAPKPASQPEAEPTTSVEPTDATQEEKQATEDEEMAKKKAESDKIKAENCKAARHNLDVYTNIGNRLLKTPDGLYERLSDEEREKRIKQEEGRIKEFCDE